jgi:Mn-dependent DtxR family transcriptional regulator
MRVQQSREDYLETILLLSEGGNPIRSIDIAAHMQFSKPSVCRAVALLRKDGLISMDQDKMITLTEKGKTSAAKIYEKHLFFRHILEQAGVDKDLAAQDACRIEHMISDESFDKVKASYEKKHGYE